MWVSLMSGKRFNHFCDKVKYDKLREQYRGVRDYGFKDDEVGWYGFVASFNGRFFDGGYSGCSSGRDYIAESARNIEKQIPKMGNITFHSSCYTELDVPKNSLIYCDIPYKNTKQYSNSKGFNYKHFYDWCCLQRKRGNNVLVSEFNIPDGRFEEVWQRDIKTQIGLGCKHNKVEKIFKVK